MRYSSLRQHLFIITTAAAPVHLLSCAAVSLAFRIGTFSASPSHHCSQRNVMWDPETQTYTDGVVPSHHSALEIEELLQCNDGKLKIFGYGSLCWHPGSEGVLALANKDIDADGKPKRVMATTGRAIGYRRCWSQRSADHRGTTEFNGIVCTLLSDEEVRSLHHYDGSECALYRPSLTEGMIYTVDEELVDDCLAELDFREKGGYARDVIDVIEDGTGKTVKALLYRGTPENPAFWKRAYLDLAYAAAIISVAIGPSGSNDVYLFHLDEFLSNAAYHSPEVATMLNEHAQDDRTSELANMVKQLQSYYRPYFLFGSGSNEHNQLLLNTKADDIDRTDEVNELTEMLLVVPRNESSLQNDEPESIHAGGGHSALLTSSGDLYLWGWNEAGQLGRKGMFYNEAPGSSLLSPIQPLGIKVETVSLGHTHTLVIEKGTKKLFAFGENGRGQVTCITGSDKTCHQPSAPNGLADETFIDVSAGLFHSAAVTEDGELVTWGCGRFGQCIAAVGSTVGRWGPSDGSKLVKVVCGRRHTVVLDEHGRVWSMGDNKYGQLGRLSGENCTKPQLVDGPLGQRDSGCITIHSGWSHLLALVRHKDSDKMIMFGWGRNDKHQLGISPNHHIFIPQAMRFLDGNAIQSVCCGAESSHILDELGNIYSTGWNEHGNLGIGINDNPGESDDSQWRKVSGANVVAPSTINKKMKKVIAAGGAHLIAMTM